MFKFKKSTTNFTVIAMCIALLSACGSSGGSSQLTTNGAVLNKTPATNNSTVITQSNTTNTSTTSTNTTTTQPTTPTNTATTQPTTPTNTATTQPTTPTVTSPVANFERAEDDMARGLELNTLLLSFTKNSSTDTTGISGTLNPAQSVMIVEQVLGNRESYKKAFTQENLVHQSVWEMPSDENLGMASFGPLKLAEVSVNKLNVTDHKIADKTKASTSLGYYDFFSQGVPKSQYIVYNESQEKTNVTNNEATFPVSNETDGNLMLYSEIDGVFENQPLYAYKSKFNLERSMQNGGINANTVSVYDVGKVSGVNQAYTSLYAWKVKNVEDNNNLFKNGTMASVAFARYVYNPENSTFQRNNSPELQSLKATYTGIAFSNDSMSPDGKLNMDVEFKDGGPINISGMISERKADNGRPIFISSYQGRDKFVEPYYYMKATDDEINQNLTMKTTSGHILVGNDMTNFAGPNAEEVVGVIQFDKANKERSTVGFIGKR